MCLKWGSYHISYEVWCYLLTCQKILYLTAMGGGRGGFWIWTNISTIVIELMWLEYMVAWNNGLALRHLLLKFSCWHLLIAAMVLAPWCLRENSQRTDQLLKISEGPAKDKLRAVMLLTPRFSSPWNTDLASHSMQIY